MNEAVEGMLVVSLGMVLKFDDFPDQEDAILAELDRVLYRTVWVCPSCRRIGRQTGGKIWIERHVSLFDLLGQSSYTLMFILCSGVFQRVRTGTFFILVNYTD